MNPEKLWAVASSFLPSNLHGEYAVKVLFGPLWLRALNVLKDRKIIWFCTGYNKMFGRSWGYFNVKKICEPSSILLDYENGKIKDYIRRVAPGYFIGKFYLNGKFRGYFELKKIK